MDRNHPKTSQGVCNGSEMTRIDANLGSEVKMRWSPYASCPFEDSVVGYLASV